jgi:diguanylate cyclase (GGDEF)-like protein/PAS domain S-box-containing protein
VSAARLILLPWLILAAALSVTWLVWDHERQTTRKELRSQFDFSLREAVSRVEQRMSANEQMLRGVQGLFATTGVMDHDTFSGYVGSLQFDANFSGIQDIGVAEQVPTARKETHVAAMRQLGFRDYAIQPEGVRENYAPIIQRESYVGRNRVEPGFDAWTDPVLRLAMELARDSGMAAISGKVRLVVDAEADATPGFVMYLPIYAPGQPHDNIAHRRINLVGWVFASFRMNDLMASLYGEQPPGLVFAIYDGIEPSDAVLLYRSAEAGSRRQLTTIAANEYLVVAGHTWTLSVSALDDFEARFAHDAAPLIAGAGTGLSLLLALLAWLMATGRARALRVAAEMTRELRESEEKFQSLFELSPDAIIVATRAGIIRTVNRQVERLLGYTRVELVGQVIENLIPARFHPDHVAQRENYSRDPHLRTMTKGRDLFARRKDGSECPVDVNLSPITTPEGTMVISTIRDITERKQLEGEVRQLAFHDPLTKLPNRRLLNDRLSQTMAASKRSGCYCALMFLDLDNFKLLNDTRGHVVGDLLLIEAADRLKSCVREMDTVARFGGDEFVVILSDLSADKRESVSRAEIVAEKIRIALSEPYLLTIKYEGKADTTTEHYCTASIGVTLFINHESSQDDILKWADTAMYQTKEAGRNSIRFYDLKA